VVVVVWRIGRVVDGARMVVVGQEAVNVAGRVSDRWVVGPQTPVVGIRIEGTPKWVVVARGEGEQGAAVAQWIRIPE